jgi:hypothetical protein
MATLAHRFRMIKWGMPDLTSLWLSQRQKRQDSQFASSRQVCLHRDKQLFGLRIFSAYFPGVSSSFRPGAIFFCLIEKIIC